MSIQRKTFTDIEELKKEVKKKYIEPVILFIEKKIEKVSNPDGYFHCYNIISNYADLGDNESESLFLFHNEVAKDYIEKCFKIISSQPKD
jgi:hypothetical protein